MGTSRYDVDRQTKLSEILDEAHAQLARAGYEGLSVSAVARALGVRPNTITWYFPTKDDLLIAVARREWDRAADPTAERLFSAKLGDGPPLTAFLAGLDLIYQRRYLAIAIHQRLDQSALVKEFHDSLYDAGRALGPALLEGIVPDADKDVLTSIILTLIEGQLLHDMTDDQRHTQIAAVLNAFAATPERAS